MPELHCTALQIRWVLHCLLVLVLVNGALYACIVADFDTVNLYCSWRRREGREGRPRGIFKLWSHIETQHLEGSGFLSLDSEKMQLQPTYFSHLCCFRTKTGTLHSFGQIRRYQVRRDFFRQIPVTKSAETFRLFETAPWLKFKGEGRGLFVGNFPSP